MGSDQPTYDELRQFLRSEDLPEPHEVPPELRAELMRWARSEEGAHEIVERVAIMTEMRYAQSTPDGRA